MLRTAFTLVLLLMVSIAACGGSATGAVEPGPASDFTLDESAAPEEQVVALVENLAAHTNRATPHCGQVNAAISTWLDAHESKLSALTTVVEGQNNGVSDAKIDELDARLDRAWDVVFAGTKPCTEETRPALDRLHALLN